MRIHNNTSSFNCKVKAPREQSPYTCTLLPKNIWGTFLTWELKCQDEDNRWEQSSTKQNSLIYKTRAKCCFKNEQIGALQENIVKNSIKGFKK